MYEVGAVVVKPGLGICRIKAIRKMTVEGREQKLYVLQSGDVKVMVPLDQAHAGGLRPVLRREEIAELEDGFRSPLPMPREDRDDPEYYAIEWAEAEHGVKRRDIARCAEVLKRLFYKSKLVKLDNREENLFEDAMKCVADEVAHHEHGGRQKAAARILEILAEGRRARRGGHL